MIWLISDIILLGKFVTTVTYLFRPKLRTLKIHPFFILPLLPMSLPELQAKFHSGTDTSKTITQQYIQH